jgi:hypothetical protein
MYLGIQREDTTLTGGIGDKGKVKTSIAHVASIKIGGIEFTNCAVEILEQWGTLESDGLIGGDVFADSLLTLDFPKHQLRLSPLPERPGVKRVDSTATEVEDIEPHDPYVAPGMESWQRVFRSGHDLLIRTGIVDSKHTGDEGAWKEKLFLLDSGSQTNLISTTAAPEVTTLRRDYFQGMRGISGEVKSVFEASRFNLSFAGLHEDSLTMTAIDLNNISHEDGVEVSGIIGAATLYHLAMHIDYRDNMVFFEHKPHQ